MGMMDLDLKPYTRTTLRPDYEAMISSGYELQTRANRRAMAALRGPSWQTMSAVGRGMGSMVSEYNRAYGAARTANEQRYQQMLNIAGQTTGQRAADIRSAYGQRESGIMQQLARTGMANTTVAPTMGLGIERERQSALNRLADQMQQTKLGIIERRKDAYPEMAPVASAIQQVGAGLGGRAGLKMFSKLMGQIRQQECRDAN